MDQLPKEILTYILSHLSLKEIAKFAEVNRICRSTSSSDVLWKPICEKVLQDTEKIILERKEEIKYNCYLVGKNSKKV